MHPLLWRYGWTGRLPKTERKMYNHYATHNLWRYWVDILYTIPENLFFRDFFVSARLADTTHTPCFVLLHQIIQNETVGVSSIVGQVSRNNPSPQGSLLGHALFCFLISETRNKTAGVTLGSTAEAGKEQNGVGARRGDFSAFIQSYFPEEQQ